MVLQSALTARLEKVRQRRIKQLQAQGKEVPASLLEPVKIEVGLITFFCKFLHTILNNRMVKMLEMCETTFSWFC